jgi:hypothetical protein
MRPGRAIAIALSLTAATVVAASTRGSRASFTAQASNPGNSMTAAASFPGIRVASGSYTGNGAAGTAVSVGFQPEVVIVKSDDASGVAEMRTSTMSGDNTKPLSGATGLTASLIQSLTSSGFTIGSAAAVNSSGKPYHWVAFKSYSGQMGVGSYAGNGAVGHAITGLGFSPEYVIVLAAGAQRADQRMAGMSRTYQFDSDTGTTTGITSLDPNGFTVGTDAEVNASGSTYHYLGFNQNVGEMKTSSYPGTGSSHSITGVGFQPAYLIIHADNSATARAGAHRSGALTGTSSQLFTAAINETIGITALQSDGFQVGTSTTANASGTTYDYVAFKDKP